MTPEDILAVIATELSTTPAMTTYVALARNRTSISFFGAANYSLAVALLAAHMWALNTKRPGQAGVVTYEGAGRLLRSNGGVGVIREEYGLTNYGMQLQGLIHDTGKGVLTTSQDIFNLYLAGST